MPFAKTTRLTLLSNPDYWVDVKDEWSRLDRREISNLRPAGETPTKEENDAWGLKIMERIIVGWNLESKLSPEAIDDELTDADYNLILDHILRDRRVRLEAVTDPNASSGSPTSPTPEKATPQTASS